MASSSGARSTIAVARDIWTSSALRSPSEVSPSRLAGVSASSGSTWTQKAPGKALREASIWLN